MDSKKGNSKGAWWQPSLLLFTRLSGWIGGPVILAIFIGKWLDRKYHTDPWLFLLTVGLAFIISMVGITRDATEEMKRIEKEAKKSKSEDKKI